MDFFGKLFSSFCSSDSFMKQDDEVQVSDGLSITQELKYSEQARTRIKINTHAQSEHKHFKYNLCPVLFTLLIFCCGFMAVVTVLPFLAFLRRKLFQELN